MHQITEFRQTLQPLLGWHGARLTFVAQFLIALLRTRTVNLSELAASFCGPAQIASNYQRLQRFFCDFDVDYPAIARAVVALMRIPQPWVLAVDRTEWSFGGSVFNILTLGICHQGISFPVVFLMLDKRGNSNTQERIDFWGGCPPAVLDQRLGICRSRVVVLFTANLSHSISRTDSGNGNTPQ